MGNTPVAHISASDNDAEPTIVYLHTDHLNTPRLATNQQQTTVWQWHSDAFGVGDANDDPDNDGKPTVINLRFPGQYYDEESGLYYNYHRYYDPTLGRYTQSDPIGLADGVNSFAYVHGNPVSGIDPLGLYEIDIHYYMTFFLGVTAGLSTEDARTMALATQYIDDNPLTRPTEPGWEIITSPLKNQEQLLAYHFTLWSKAGDGNNAEDYTFSTDTNYNNPTSPQLDALYGYSTHVPAGECGFSNNLRLQFMGEYLHAFEDTFAHRDRNNKPYSAFGWFDLGTGHGLDGHDPDYTYDHKVCTPTSGPGGKGTVRNCTEWNNNEARTLEMERETYAKIQEYMRIQNYGLAGGQQGSKTDFADIEAILQDFNEIPESDHNMGDFLERDAATGELKSEKLKKLQDWLYEAGYRNANGSEIVFDEDAQGYSKDWAEENRGDAFNGLNRERYPSVMLPSG